MRLPRPFFRLPVRFEVERLRAEVAALPPDAWAGHPNEIAGNHSVRLISVDGGENDDVDGAMLPTPHLARSPYIRQVLASFGVVWSRSRLLRLAPGATVPPHADINHHWFYRVRLHVPVLTHPEVLFTCDGETVHMAAGEAWVFDNWRQHSVVNPTPAQRVHLVADTSGSAAFWEFVARSDAAGSALQEHHFDPARDASPLTERTLPPRVLPPAEVELLVMDLRAELATRDDSPQLRAQLASYHRLLNSFTRDWRQLYALHGDAPAGLGEYEPLIAALRAASRELGDGLLTAGNRVAAHQVLEGRVLRAAVRPPRAAGPVAPRAQPLRSRPALLQRPIFIVAAPRSGSTLLFESLARAHGICTLGDEAHWLVEGLPELRPGAPDVESNRLEARHATAAVADHIVGTVLAQLEDHAGRPLTPASSQNPPRWLEKTPKNALRIPFFEHIFPDALFVFLWRRPHESLSSIIEAWRSGRSRTYNGLPGFDGPWSLLLPPGWPACNGRPLAEIAAFQWRETNRVVLDDLAALPRQRWMHLSYETLVAQPAAAVQRVCAFAGLEFDTGLAARVAGPLPHSRYTHTPPDPAKWRSNEAEIARVLHEVECVWARLRALEPIA